MKFLIAGFGSIGRRHFRNLRALGQDDVLFLRSGRSQLPTQELIGVPAETELDAALAHQPDAVIIANPTSKHLEVAIPAAQAGCHILLEKPISHSMSGVDALVKAVEESGSRVLVGFQFRFHPGLQAAREVLLTGELGQPLRASVRWGEYLPDWHPWEKDFRESYSARGDLGGGVVLTLSHPFDYLHWLFGRVTALTGTTSNSGELGIEVEERAEARLEFASGATAEVELDYLQKPPIHQLEIECAAGRLHWDALTDVLTKHRAEGGPPEDFERNDLFLAQMQHFIEVVAGQAAPSCTLADGIHALEIALAVHQSAERGAKVLL